MAMSDQLSSDLASLKIDREAKPGGGGLVRTALVLALIGGGLAAAYLVGWPYLRARIYKTAVEYTEISMISPAHDSTDFTSTGHVVPQTTARVGAKIPGRLAELMVKINQDVTAGQPIARLEDIDQKAALAAANSRVAAARARAQTARAQLAETKQQAERERKLVAQGASPKAVLEDLDARVHSLAVQVQAADADVRATEAEMATLKINLDAVVIVAPISGTVIQKFAETGELVGPASGPIVEIDDLTSQVVETDVQEARVGKVKLQTHAEIVLDMYPNIRMPGEVVEISKRVDRAKATVMVKVKFTGDMTTVIPNMSARVSFLTRAIDAKEMAEPPKLIVPESAVTDRDGAKVVFVVRDGKVKQTPVVLGAKLGAMGYELTNGTPAVGTKVVAHPPADLRDGQAVKQASK